MKLSSDVPTHAVELAGRQPGLVPVAHCVQERPPACNRSARTRRWLRRFLTGNNFCGGACAVCPCLLNQHADEPSLLRRQSLRPARPPRDRIRCPHLPRPAVQLQQQQQSNKTNCCAVECHEREQFKSRTRGVVSDCCLDSIRGCSWGALR